MNSAEIRQKFLDFFEKKGHKVMPSASLVPENDPSVLFTTAGMQQFKPYYLHPETAPAKNIVSIQKCVRTSDIDEVGDDSHLTFFEMLGNFSFGGYWKKEAINYAYEFITKELKLKIDYVSVFEGDVETPADNESKEIWKSIDPNLIIKNHNRADNFWGPTGNEGPCGPTTEIYINGVEIWNIVFNEYYKTKEGKYTPLEIKGIDTGMGLERLLVQGLPLDKTGDNSLKSVYNTDLFERVMDIFHNSPNVKIKNEKTFRIIADHLRTSFFMILDGVLPNNEGRGYVLRRLIRRMVRYMDDTLQLGLGTLTALSSATIEPYISIYPELALNAGNISNIIKDEEERFRKTLKLGLKEFEKGTDPFILATTYGFPIELTLELAKEKNIKIDLDDFNRKMSEHQKLSQTSSSGMFKGGLAGHGEMETKYHTATHLLHQALHDVLGDEVGQKGSNITSERLRFDFSFPRKLTDEEKGKVEEIVNQKIKEALPVNKVLMPKEEAEKTGARHFFDQKYPDEVSIYYIGDSLENAYSKEFCGGPHVSNISELGTFKIQKEEAVSAGVRRIKAVLQ